MTLTAAQPAAAASSSPESFWQRPTALALFALVTVGLIGASLAVGVYDLSAEGGWEMFRITRVPRTIALVMSGSALAVGGVVLQQLTQNRFVSPTTAGTSEWAGLGLLLSVIVVPQASLALRMVLASLAAVGGTLAFMAILQRVQLRTSLIVPIVGIMLGAVVSAITTVIAISTDYLQLLGTWFMGSFTPVVRGRYEILWVVGVICVAIFFLADRLTVAGLGKDVATNVGLRYRQVMLVGTAMVGVASGVTAVVVGMLPFVGLVVPNIVSLLRGDDLRSNLPWVCLGGISLVTFSDVVGRLIRTPFEIPASMILGIVGAAAFITLVLRLRWRV